MKQKKKRYSFYLTKLEKNVLYKKYYALGISPEIIRIRINGVSEQLTKLVSKLRKKNIPEEKIDIEFKEEFAKLCEASS